MQDAGTNRAYVIAIARAFAGALLFSLPILMTMETWTLGFSMERYRLALLIAAMLPLLVALSYYSGIEETTGVWDAMLDAFAAIAVTTLMATAFLFLFGVLTIDSKPDEWIGTIALQAVPGSVGALLAQSQFGKREENTPKRREAGSLGEYFFMCVGALFLAANIAPTEEVLLIAQLMSPWHSIALAVTSLVLMHALVYSVEFRGQHDRPEHISAFSMFFRFTLAGYAIALGISAFICWSFGRFDGLALEEIIQTSIVLGLPASVGAATARLVL